MTEGAIINVTFLSAEVVSKEREGVRDRGQRRGLKMEKSSQQDRKRWISPSGSREGALG